MSSPSTEPPVGGRPPTAGERARKIRPEYTQGEPVRVAGGTNQAEAEMIQGMLLEEGIPSMLRRTRGFDVPDFLAAGPRDVLVPESGYDAARSVLLEAELIGGAGGREDAAVSPSKLLLGILVAVGIAALISFGLYALYF